MQHLDEGTIHAWLDGELPPAERNELEAHIASCAQCAAAVAEARGFVAASSRILTALDRVPSGVLPASDPIVAAGVGARKRFTMSRAWMAAAAVLVLSTVTVIASRPGQDDKLARVAFQQDSQASRESLQRPAPAVGAATPATAPAPTVPMNAPAQLPRATAGSTASRSANMVDVAGKPAAAPPPTEASPARKQDETAARAAARAPELSPESALAKRLTHERVRDSLRLPRPSLSRVTIAGGAPTANEKLDAAAGADSKALDSTAPRIVSRNTSTSAGDTVVTTIYEVNGATVSLIDRSRTHDESEPIRIRGSMSQPVAKVRDTVAQINSVTWSDASGHTRTLRGAVSREELEHIRAALFGSTP